MEAKTIQRKKIRNRSFQINASGDFKKIVKKMEKAMAGDASREVRARIIESAYYIRDAVASNAPKAIYGDIIQGTPLEKFENRNSGFDVSLDSNMNANFELSLSTMRFSKSEYKGYNPIIGLLVSNYGRGPITASGGKKIPIPSDDGKTAYDHPVYGTGYNSMYADKKVKFVKSVAGVSGSFWIEAGVQGASAEARRILADKSDYKVKSTTNTYWRQ